MLESFDKKEDIMINKIFSFSVELRLYIIWIKVSDILSF